MASGHRTQVFRAPWQAEPGDDWRHVPDIAGAVAALDFVGSEPSSGFGLSVLRKGGRLVVVGLYGGQLTMPLPFLPMQARVIEGNYVGNLQDMDELMGLVRAGRIPPIQISERPASEAGEVLADLKAGRILGRAVLRHA